MSSRTPGTVEDTDTAEALLAWADLQDSAFPAGRFVHSNGLEAWLAAHPAAREDEIVELTLAHVGGATATLDAVFLAHAWREPERAAELDRLLTAHKTTASARSASEKPGGQLALVADRVLPDTAGSTYLDRVRAGELPGNQAIVEAVLHRGLGIALDTTVQGHLRATLAGLLSAAVRLGRLGALSSRRALFVHRATLVGLAASAAAAPLGEVTATMPELEIHAMRHETAVARLFTT